ncbi:MAG: hypothetical protein R2910_03140 [Gemmatimonadales bacterium]
MRRSLLALLLLLPAAGACNDPLAVETGGVEIDLAVTGPDGHAGAFTVAIDGGAPVGVSGSGSVVSGLASGHHTIALGGLASNCTPEGEASRSFAINPSETTVVTFAVTCTATSGAIDMRVTTTGSDPDLDGYRVSLDGGTPRPIPTNGVTRFSGLSGGIHTLSLSGLAPNCSALVSNPLEVSVPVGGSVSEVVSAPIDVACTATTGSIRVSAVTTGPEPDALYSVTLNGGAPRAVLANGSIQVNQRSPGSYAVLLTDIAPNCAVSGPNPVTVTVSIGDTTDVAFAVACLPSPTLRVTVSTTGSDIPGRFLAFVDDDGGWYSYPAYTLSVPSNGTDSVVVEAGEHVVALAYLPANCVVTSPTQVPVTLPAGSTVDVAFTVTCTPLPILRVTVVTTGINAPAAYLVGVDPDYYYYYYSSYRYSANIPSNGTVSIGLPVGSHFVTLDQVPLNCVVTSPNNVLVNVALGVTTDLAYTVSCQ